jgi:hypothetical protein
MVMKFFFDRYDFTSSGAVAALVQGLLAKELWKRGLPRKLSGKPTWKPGNLWSHSCHGGVVSVMQECADCPGQLV